MRLKIYILSIVLFFVFLLFYYKSKELQPSEKVKEYYTSQVTTLKNEVDILITLHTKGSDEELRKQFLKCRSFYKRIEPFVEYYNPSTAKAINGPALVEVEPDNPEYPTSPSGFQVVEEKLFPDVDQNHKSLHQDLLALKAAVQHADMVNKELNLNDQAIFDALRLQLFRIQILGISGFDSPIAQNSIPETQAAINSILQYLRFYNLKQISNWQKIAKELNAYLDHTKSFNSLDRAFLLTKFFNPLGNELNKIQQNLQIPFFEEARPLKANASTLFDKNIFNAAYYSPSQKQSLDSNLLGLGEMLFFESRLSSNGKRSCGSCHNPGKAFTDGLTKNKSFDGKSLILRNTPTILYAGLQAAQFADSRIAFLEDQVKQVAENPLEMHGNLKQSLKVIKSDTLYQQKFAKAFLNKEPTELKIQEAIAGYIRSKNAFNSRFDLYMQGDQSKLNAKEIKGFNLFMGKAKCGSCHFMPLFNGNIPPVYIKSESEVLGVPENKKNAKIDSDLGKFNLYRALPHKHSFKTPTLRNSALTAPYMHNGVYNTLEEVIDFYNTGGGVGLKIKVDNQTLPPDSLGLSNQEKQAIISFLKTLSDDSPSKNYP